MHAFMGQHFLNMPLQDYARGMESGEHNVKPASKTYQFE